MTMTRRTAHKCVWVSLSSAELTRQLRACTDGFAEWKGVAPTGWVGHWKLQGSQHNLDDTVWIATYFGWTPVLVGFEMAFEHVEKRPYAD